MYDKGIEDQIITPENYVLKAIGCTLGYYGELELIREELNKTETILARLIEHLNLKAEDINKIVQHFDEIEEVDDVL